MNASVGANALTRLGTPVLGLLCVKIAALTLAVKLNINHHRFQAAQRIDSPNFDERPDADDISLIVIHGISLPPEQFGGDHIAEFFCNRLSVDAHPFFAEIQALKVSAHLLIRREGALLQFVAFDKRAWHAGQSHFRGRDRCNDFSIGIELEGADCIPYTDRQYLLLAKVINELRSTYPGIDERAIVGHCDVAPGRKTDPGPAFDWPRLFRLLAADFT